MDLWIADVDGVFTNLKAQPNKDAIRLSTQVGSSVPFVYLTGRAARWLELNLIPTLEQGYRQHVPRLPVLCAEYGGIIMRYGLGGQWWQESNSAIPITDQLRNQIRVSIKAVGGVFYDEAKQVMVSVEAQHSLRDTAPHIIESGLDRACRLLQVVAEQNPGLECHRTTYACDLVPAGLNRKFGARFILDHAGFTPSHVYMLGDSPADLQLADVMSERGLPYTMYYVGDPSGLSSEHKGKYQLAFPESLYDQGTIEVLSSFI